MDWTVSVIGVDAERIVAWCQELRREIHFDHLVRTGEMIPGTGPAQGWCSVGYNVMHCSCDEMAKGTSGKIQLLKKSWAEKQVAKDKQVVRSRH
jgi:hypothetical protein